MIDPGIMCRLGKYLARGNRYQLANTRVLVVPALLEKLLGAFADDSPCCASHFGIGMTIMVTNDAMCNVQLIQPQKQHGYSRAWTVIDTSSLCLGVPYGFLCSTYMEHQPLYFCIFDTNVRPQQ